MNATVYKTQFSPRPDSAPRNAAIKVFPLDVSHSVNCILNNLLNQGDPEFDELVDRLVSTRIYHEHYANSIYDPDEIKAACQAAKSDPEIRAAQYQTALYRYTIRKLLPENILHEHRCNNIAFHRLGTDVVADVYPEPLIVKLQDAQATTLVESPAILFTSVAGTPLNKLPLTDTHHWSIVYTDLGQKLDKSHHHKIFNHDFGPHNVLADDTGIVSLIDFGLAAYVDDNGLLVLPPLEEGAIIISSIQNYNPLSEFGLQHDIETIKHQGIYTFVSMMMDSLGLPLQIKIDQESLPQDFTNPDNWSDLRRRDNLLLILRNICFGKYFHQGAIPFPDFGEFEAAARIGSRSLLKEARSGQIADLYELFSSYFRSYFSRFLFKSEYEWREEYDSASNMLQAVKRVLEA